MLETPLAPNRNGSYEDHVMAKKPLPSPEVLRQLLRYEPETGRLFWKERPGTSRADRIFNTKFAGTEAFRSVDHLGYHQSCVSFGGQRIQLRAHRVIWAIVTGEWPTADVDHINGKKTDNRLGNLRAATRSQNIANKRPLGGSSRFIGVSLTRCGKWQAYVSSDGCRHTKNFADEYTAAAWRDRTAREIHGDFSRMNFDNGAGSYG